MSTCRYRQTAIIPLLPLGNPRASRVASRCSARSKARHTAPSRRKRSPWLCRGFGRPRHSYFAGVEAGAVTSRWSPTSATRNRLLFGHPVVRWAVFRVWAVGSGISPRRLQALEQLAESVQNQFEKPSATWVECYQTDPRGLRRRSRADTALQVISEMLDCARFDKGKSASVTGDVLICLVTNALYSPGISSDALPAARRLARRQLNRPPLSVGNPRRPCWRWPSALERAPSPQRTNLDPNLAGRAARCQRGPQIADTDQ
jgi:hypothetical protein